MSTESFSVLRSKVKSNTSKLISTVAIILFGVVLWNISPPEGLNLRSWHLLNIFVCTIAGVILKPLPMGSVSFIALTISIVTHTLSTKEALNGFASPVVWLVFCAFLISGAFIRTGLGSRIAYKFIEKFGKDVMGLSFGLIITEFILAPFIPSNTARGGGVIYPILNSLSLGYDSKPRDKSRKRIGAYLVKLCFQANTITSAMFMTALAGNALIVSLASDSGVEINMVNWALATIVPGIICLVVLPFILMMVYPPELKHTPEAPKRAKEKLSEMGPLSFDERVMLQTFIVLLFLWVFGRYINIDPTSATLVGVSILLLSGTLSIDDILREKGAWNTFLWLGVFLMLATSLKTHGMMDWFSEKLQVLTTGKSWVYTLSILGLMYYLIHYLYASVTAHISSLYSAFLTVAIYAGAPSFAAAMILAILSSLSGGLTHYGTGAAPIFFSSGYVKIKEWWSIGAFIGLINILIFIIVGYAWWKVLGII